MLRAYHELVAVARVFEVVDQACREHSQLVVLLKVLLHVAHLHHKVESLQ